jgi:sugar phosphate isomerase/epimerase
LKPKAKSQELRAALKQKGLRLRFRICTHTGCSNHPATTEEEAKAFAYREVPVLSARFNFDLGVEPYVMATPGKELSPFQAACK